MTKLKIAITGMTIREKQRVKILFCESIKYNTYLKELTLHTTKKKDSFFENILSFLLESNALSPLPFTTLGVILRPRVMPLMISWLGMLSFSFYIFSFILFFSLFHLLFFPSYFFPCCSIAHLFSLILGQPTCVLEKLRIATTNAGML